MTVDDFGGRRTISAEELLVLVGDYVLLDASGDPRGYIESVGQSGTDVAVTITDGVDGSDTIELLFAPDADVVVEPSERGKAPVIG